MKKELVQQLPALITAAFGLVATLAWNAAMQEIFRLVLENRVAYWQ